MGQNADGLSGDGVTPVWVGLLHMAEDLSQYGPNCGMGHTMLTLTLDLENLGGGGVETDFDISFEVNVLRKAIV